MTNQELPVFVLSCMAEVDMTLGVYSSAERAKAAAGPLLSWELLSDGSFRGTVEGDRETSWCGAEPSPEELTESVRRMQEYDQRASDE